jgi:hypothetical protein
MLGGWQSPNSTRNYFKDVLYCHSDPAVFWREKNLASARWLLRLSFLSSLQSGSFVAALLRMTILRVIEMGLKLGHYLAVDSSGGT